MHGETIKLVCPVIYTQVPRRVRNPAERLLKWLLAFVRLVCRSVRKYGIPRQSMTVFILNCVWCHGALLNFINKCQLQLKTGKNGRVVCLSFSWSVELPNLTDSQNRLYTNHVIFTRDGSEQSTEMCMINMLQTVEISSTIIIDLQTIAVETCSIILCRPSVTSAERTFLPVNSVQFQKN